MIEMLSTVMPLFLISGLVNLFSRFAFGEKILFRRPWYARESYYISIQELFGLFWKF